MSKSFLYGFVWYYWYVFTESPSITLPSFSPLGCGSFLRFVPSYRLWIEVFHPLFPQNSWLGLFVEALQISSQRRVVFRYCHDEEFDNFFRKCHGANNWMLVSIPRGCFTVPLETNAVKLEMFSFISVQFYTFVGSASLT